MPVNYSTFYLLVQGSVNRYSCPYKTAPALAWPFHLPDRAVTEKTRIQEGSVLKNAAFNTALPCPTRRRVAKCDAAIFLTGGLP